MAIKKDLIIRIGSNVDDLQKGLNKAEMRVRAFNVSLAAIGAAGIASLNTFAGFETRLAGVSKTTGLAGDALQNYGNEIQKLSVVTGQSTNQLLEISQAAGQLGVTGSERLQKFTDTIAKLGTASDLQGENAATTLTRILNVTGEGVYNIDQFASVIVRLGNNFAASESEIARMAQEVSRATAVFGVGSAESAALGTALRSVGVQAELGGSVVGKAFRTIDESIRNGGKELETLQLLTGMTGEQLKKTFEEDSTKVFQKFVEGLGDVKQSGGSVAGVLELFGLKGDEVNKVLPVLAERADLLGDAINHAGEEVRNTTALEKEFEVQSQTLDNNLNRLMNSVTNLASDIGSGLAPAVSYAAGKMADDISQVSESFLGLGDIFKGVFTIISEGLNFLIGKFDEFAAGSLRAVAATIEQIQNLADVLPFVEDSFQGSIDAINAKADEYQAASEERMQRSNAFFRGSEEDKTLALEEGLEARNEKQMENDALMDEYDAERREEKLELDEERREEDLEIEDARHEEDKARREEQLKQLELLEAKNRKTQLADKKKAEKLLEKAKGDRVKVEEKLDNQLVKSSFEALQSIVGDNKAASIALMLARKGVAIAQTLINAQEAASLAIATVPPPAGEAIAAKRLAMGKLAAATIAATAIPEIAGSFSARTGGVVPGTGSGDRPFGFLEPGEIIVPKPLAETFEQRFGNFSKEGGGSGDVNVVIGLSDEASQVFSVQLYEDQRIGVSR